MNWTEIEFTLVDDAGKEVMKNSIFDVDSKHELASLKVGQRTELDTKHGIKECVVLKQDWGDYNIRGMLLTYDLKLV